jgi:predicted deacylase
MCLAKWVATSIVCVYAFLISVHAQQGFTVGSVSAAPGTKASGFIDVTEYASILAVEIDTIASSETGMFHPKVKRGNFVAAGSKIGYVTDYFGNVVEEGRAPASGVVLYICAVPSMKNGDTVAFVGEVSAQKP